MLPGRRLLELLDRADLILIALDDITVLRRVRYTFSPETVASQESIAPHPFRNRYISF